MKKAGVILIGLLHIASCGYGQDQVILSGTIRDTLSAPISKATVHLITQKDSVTIFSREDGSFTFYVMKNGTFALEVTMKGYRPFRHSYQISPGSRSFVLPPIIMHVNYEELEPVTISTIRSLIVGEDTVEYRAGAYSVRPGAELERLLKLLPDILTDTGGNFIVEGKKISRLMVNGRDFVGGDVLTALRNIPADIIDKIQIIDDYGDKARLTGVKSGESAKVINVILKEDKRNGIIGKLEAGAGDLDKYIASSFLDAFKGDRQLTLNTRLDNNSPVGNLYEKLSFLGYSNCWNKKWSENVGISFGGDDHSTTGTSLQDNFFPGTQQYLKQDNQQSGNKTNMMISNTLKYSSDVNTVLRISSSLGVEKTTENNSDTSSTLEKDSGYTKTTNSNFINQSHAHSLTAGFNIYFEKRYPHSKSRLSLEASYVYSRQQQDQTNQSNTTIHSDSLDSYSEQHYLVHTSNTAGELATHVNYYLPLGYKSFLELAYTWNCSVTQNDLLTRVPTSTQRDPVMVDSLSNTYTFQTMKQHFHAGYLTHSNKINLTLGLDAQPASQDGKTTTKGVLQAYHYFNLLPMAQISYSFSTRRKLRFDYVSSSSAPSLQQLQPVIDLSNPQYPVEGNPFLKPSYAQSAILHYEQSSLKANQFSGFGIGIGYNNTRDMIITNVVHPRDTTAVIQKISYSNANGFRSLKADYHINFPAFLHNRVRINIDGDITTSHATNMADSIPFTTTSLGWDQGLSIGLNIPDVTESTLAGNYSQTFTRYSSNESPNTQFYSFNWVFNNRHTFFQRWVLIYTVRQAFTSGATGSLKANPALLDASVKRDFLPRNEASLSLAVNNLLNQNVGVSQSVTPTSLTQNRTTLTGRYFMISMVFKIEKFK